MPLCAHIPPFFYRCTPLLKKEKAFSRSKIFPSSECRNKFLMYLFLRNLEWDIRECAQEYITWKKRFQIQIRSVVNFCCIWYCKQWIGLYMCGKLAFSDPVMAQKAYFQVVAVSVRSSDGTIWRGPCCTHIPTRPLPEATLSIAHPQYPPIDNSETSEHEI